MMYFNGVFLDLENSDFAKVNFEGTKTKCSFLRGSCHIQLEVFMFEGFRALKNCWFWFLQNRLLKYLNFPNLRRKHSYRTPLLWSNFFIFNNCSNFVLGLADLAHIYLNKTLAFKKTQTNNIRMTHLYKQKQTMIFSYL